MSLKNVLVIGNGGREHALAWKLAQGNQVGSVYVCPGNGGTQHGNPKISNISLELPEMVSFVKEKHVSMVVVGPEQPLVAGIVDHFKANGIPCFGPSKKASTLEASKAFSKAFMKRHNIPTARYEVFSDFETALKHLQNVDYPVVLKASGLAAGKGVILPNSKDEAIAELKILMVNKPFGSASDEVVIEERLEGPEVSVLAFTDGYTVSLMPAAQDHKRIGDNDEGANTGGMGAYAPAPIATPQFLDQVLKRVLKPTIDGMRKEGTPYVGVVYAGILVDKKMGMNVLEFNCRFGDPETQVIMPLLESDLVDVMEACVEGRLDSIDIKWKAGVSAVTVVAASKGYPSSYETGKKITGLSNLNENSFVFHAGTQSKSVDEVVTSGGRVLAVTSWAPSIQQASEMSYNSMKNINFEGIYYRKDIAKRATEQKAPASASYKDSGVDIDIADNLVDAISPLAKQTARSGTDAALGGFGGLFDVKAAGFKDPILVSGTDGVGTKLLIAQQANIHDTIGQDLVAMSVNDILVQGAEPLFFLDYFATGKLSVESAKEVIAGIARACKESNCALIGGETAEMPGMYPPGKYDLAGFAVGAVERDKVLPKRLGHGDVIIGVSSSGVHSNGFSLVRYVIERANISYDQPAPWDPSKTVAQSLLTPTKLYIKSCIPLIKSEKIKAMAHITGGGLTENIPRVLGQDDTAEIDLSTWTLPPVFKWLAQQGNIARDELIRTFNCGIGMVLIVAKENVDECLSSLQNSGEPSFRIGSIIKRAEHQVVYKNNWN